MDVQLMLNQACKIYLLLHQDVLYQDVLSMRMHISTAIQWTTVLLTMAMVFASCLQALYLLRWRRMMPEMREDSASIELLKMHSCLEWHALMALTNLT